MAPRTKITLEPHGLLPSWTTSLAIAFALVSPYVMQHVGIQDVQTSEGRELAAKPALPRNYKQLESYAERYEKYFEDRLPMRGRYLQGHSWWCRKVLGTSNTEQVVVGVDGWMYYTREKLLLDYQGLTADRDEAAKKWRAALEERVAVTEKRDISYMFFVAPNKVTVTPYGLSRHWQRAPGVQTRLHAITAELAASELPYIDQTELLSSLPRDPIPYLRTDSHWSKHGAFASYRQVAERLHQIGALPEPLPRERFRVEWWPVPGDLAVMLREQKEQDKEQMAFFKAEPELDAKEVEAPAGFAFPPELLVWEPPRFWENPKAKGRLLFIGDSFMYAQMAWWAEHFRNTLFLPCPVKSTDDFEWLIEGLRPDVVIEERVERNMRYPPKTRKPS